MYAGRIAERGPTVALHDAPRHPYTRMLFAATPDLDGHRPASRRSRARRRASTVPLVACPFAPRCDSAFETCRERAPAAAARSAPVTWPPATWPGLGRMSAAPLLDVRDLVVHYPLPRGLVGTLGAPRGARGARGRRHLADASRPASSSRSWASRAAARRPPRRRSCACSCRARARSRSTGSDIAPLSERALRPCGARRRSCSRIPTSRSTRATACATPWPSRS